MLVERDLQSISGRWFRGAYDEFGPDVTLKRVGPGPLVSGVYPASVQRDGTTTVTLHGANLPDAAADIDFGEGVVVEAVTGRDALAVSVRLRIAADARVGRRDLRVQTSILEGAIVVHDGVDRIEVTPRTGMARTGGANFPKGFQTFEAIGYDDGADGDPSTEDDLELGRVAVEWALEEYAATYGDDDVRFVGRIGADGTFDPAPDGPNPERSGNRDNVGDVWVVATHTKPDGERLSARAHLVVTIPLYIRFNPWPGPGDPRVPVGGDR
jgi:quinohemoprotein amine dehydrogenase